MSVRIDSKTGCPARAGQANAIFEVFREGHVPDCQQVGDITDPFNNAAGIDPEPEEETDEEPDQLF